MGKHRDAKGKLVLRLCKRFIYATAAMFAGMGVVMLLSALADVPPLRQQDVLFTVTTRTVLAISGLLHLLLSGYLFRSRDLMSQGIAALWAGWYHLLYLVAMAWVMKVASPFPGVVVVAWEVGLSAKAVDFVWKLFIAYLLLGGLMLVLVEWRRSKNLEAKKFLEHWGELREHKPVSATQAAPGNILTGKSAATTGSPPQPARQAEASNRPLSEFKFSCPSCGQHIRYEKGYSGRQINCPACQQPILVPRANEC